MTEQGVTQIRVDGRPVGVLGLQEAIAELSRTRTGKTEEALREALLDRLSARNYIPRSARKLYGEALLREFKRSLGEPVTDEPQGGLRVRILGEGCSNCDQMEEAVREVLVEMNLPADLDHVTDPREIGKSGVMGTPALEIDSRVVWVGSVPPKRKLKEWLERARAEAFGEKSRERRKEIRFETMGERKSGRWKSRF